MTKHKNCALFGLSKWETYQDFFTSILPTFQVIVSDNGSPALRSTATILIKVLDANDNRPKFTERRFHVKLLEQDHQAGRVEVCRTVARDDDEGSNALVTYELQDGGDDRFQIDPVTGVVTAQGNFQAGSYEILTVGGLSKVFNYKHYTSWRKKGL